MTKIQYSQSKFNLQNRTFEFAKSLRQFIKKFPNSQANFEDIKQLIRSSGSVGANYIEANDALSKKDFIYRLKVCRKEVRETYYWLKLLTETNNLSDDNNAMSLLNEAIELRNIFSAIIIKHE